jgi:low affinity Fe/Cu permease
MKSNGWFTRFANWAARATGRPMTFMLAFAIVVVWGVTGPLFHYSDTWQLVINTGTTIVTFLMVFVLNNAQSRDTAAINAKLDALIVAIEQADNRAIGLELKPDSAAKVIADEIIASAELDAANTPAA